MPRVQMTRTTRWILYILRFYLLFLMVLILIKFLRIFHH